MNGPDGAIYDTPSCTVTPGNTTKSITQVDRKQVCQVQGQQERTPENKLNQFTPSHLACNITSAASFDKLYHDTVAYPYLKIEMKRCNSIMNFTRLHTYKKSDEHIISPHLLTNAMNTSQYLYWQTHHDSKQSSCEKGPTGGTRRDHTTMRISEYERED